MTINLISLLVLALSGVAIIIYALLKRLKKEKEKNPYNPQKDDPIRHIRNKLFFEIPVEKIFFGFFLFVTITYIAKLIFDMRMPEVGLLILYLSGIIFFLAIYKMAMSVGVVNKFSPWLLLSMFFSLAICFFVYTEISEGFIELLKETRQYHLTIHFLGFIVGLGGTLIVDTMFSHFMRNFSISARESVIMHLISQMIILGLFLLILSGVALYLIDYKAFTENSRFIIKMIVVVVIIVNGGVLNLYLTPKMKDISIKEDQQKHSTLIKISFALGAISIVSWLSAFLLAMLKDLFDLPLSYLLSGYFILLIFAIVISQFAKVFYERKEQKQSNS